MAHEYYCAKCDDTFLWNRVAAGPRAGDAAPDGESLLPEAEIVFRVAAETHPGGAHAAIVAELDRLRAELEHVTGLLAEARTHRGNALDFARERQRELAETRAELEHVTGLLAETRAAGDALAAKAAEVSGDINDRYEFHSEILDDGVHEWRQATDPEYANARLGRSVRGDARTAPAADVRDPVGEPHRTSAAPTAAPDVRAWEDDGDWGWACSRCGYRSVAWWADRATARRAAHEHGRDRCPAAGGSSTASTDGGEQ